MIIPKPQKIKIKNEYLSLETPLKMYSETQMFGVLEVLKCLDGGARITDIESKADIIFRPLESECSEEYRISCNKDGLVILAAGPAAAVYALQSLRQIASFDGEEVRIPFCEIADRPRFVWRGMHLDVVRHFLDISEVYKVVDILSFYKMNRLHLHLSDDQGFRVEITKYPKLNEISAFRRGTELRNGSDSRFDETLHGGFYTKKQLGELVAYAKNRGVEIVPEIDIPGHMCAVIAAYPELSCSGEPIEVATDFGIKDFSKRILCAGNDAVYEFVKSVILEMTEIFPGAYFHLGGDEALKQEWKGCPKCRARMKELGLTNQKELQAYMLNVFSDFLKSMGRRAVLWNDGLYTNSNPDSICQQWAQDFIKPKRETIKDINNGRLTVMSDTSCMYFDYPYALTPLKKVYGYKMIPRGVKPENIPNILGIECCLWSEWIRNRDKLWFNLLPRLAAVAEIAWTSEKRLGYRDFVTRLQSHYPFYEANGYPYAKHKEKRDGFFKSKKTIVAYFSTDADIELK